MNVQKTYNSFHPKQQEILQCAALLNIGFSLTKTKLYENLRSSNIKTPAGKAITNPEFNAIMSEVIDTGFLILESPLLFYNDEAERVVLAQAIKSPTLATQVNRIVADIEVEERKYWYRSNRSYINKLKYYLLTANDKAFSLCYKALVDNQATAEDLLSISHFAEQYNLIEQQSATVSFLLLSRSCYSKPYGLESFGRELKILESRLDQLSPEDQITTKLLLADFYVLQGNIQRLQHLAKELSAVKIAGTVKGALLFLQGKYEEAQQYYDLALKEARKTIKRSYYFNSICGMFHIPCILRNDSMDHNKLDALAGQAIKATNIGVYNAYMGVLYAKAGNMTKRNTSFGMLGYDHSLTYLDKILYFFCKHWASVPLTAKEKETLATLVDLADHNGYTYLAYQGAQLLSVNTGDQKVQLEKYRNEPFAQNILYELIAPQEDWELVLESLINLSTSDSQAKEHQKAERIIWLLDPDTVDLQPKLQQRSPKGKWSSGRNISLKKLFDKEVLGMSTQDEEVAKTIAYETGGYYRGGAYRFHMDKALVALVGHPEIYLWSNNTVKLELGSTEPGMIVKQTRGKFNLEFSTDCSQMGVFLLKETLTKYNVIKVTAKHKTLYDAFGNKKLQVPAKAKAKVEQAIAGLSSMLTIQSDIKHEDDNLKYIEADSTVHILLLPYHDGLKAELFIKPFKTSEPYLKPGVGGTNIISEIDSVKVRTERSLSQEKNNAGLVLRSCAQLQNMADIHDIYISEDPLDALELLSQLQAVEDNVIIEWPQGEKFKVSKSISHQSLSISIGQKNGWFELTGELKVNEQLVLDIKQLFELLKQPKGNFIELGKGEFLALSKSLRQQLIELESFSEQSKGKIKLHPLAAIAAEQLVEQAGSFKADKAWEEQKARILQAKMVDPPVPSTLQAELRDYQQEGYRWLSQLSHMGVGACLADDMGLGKTMQSIALLLQRAADGFALVLAPASVAGNWMAEIRKFAPTLNPIELRGGNRKEKVDCLKPFDVLVCTYGLLQSESKLLTAKQWGTIILDEAHAIKNAATKTSKAAMQLTGGFKLITTGTPVQNHLGELWNLFTFINKGLLGSADAFNARYLNGDMNAKKHLKKLIQPFVLRRTKTQVLDELPEKTEITIGVELSEEETAFYEAVRQTAIQNLEEQDENKNAQFQVLAEITKMRQACCHPELVTKNCNIKSSKMTVFRELLDEIISGGHKVLVFSQFVSFLSLVRKELDKDKIAYKYLDGSTPTKQRQQSINEFQSGNGDVFLISLRAGGLGLNLTAADYVIHLDPWWNPAVEDQASDRAHRIGQTRPVTVYRLVTKNAIEEKIIQLHKSKRQLADNILEGTDQSAKISAGELLKLIKS